MNNTDFLEKMDLVDLDMVEHAAEKPRRKHVRWTYYASMAACFAVVVACGFCFSLSADIANTSGETPEGVASMIGSTPMIWILIGIVALAGGVFLAISIIKKRRPSGDN